MSKKRNENSFWNNGPDSELIARFTGVYLRGCNGKPFDAGLCF